MNWTRGPFENHCHFNFAQITEDRICNFANFGMYKFWLDINARTALFGQKGAWHAYPAKLVSDMFLWGLPSNDFPLVQFWHVFGTYSDSPFLFLAIAPKPPSILPIVNICPVLHCFQPNKFQNQGLLLGSHWSHLIHRSWNRGLTSLLTFLGGWVS